MEKAQDASFLSTSNHKVKKTRLGSTGLNGAHVGPQMLSLPQPTACTHTTCRESSSLCLVMTSGIQCYSPETTGLPGDKEYANLIAIRINANIIYCICFVKCDLVDAFFFFKNQAMNTAAGD